MSSHLIAVEQVKERLSIVEVVGPYVKLTKAGKSYKGLSPFKKEKTPSFYVSPDRGMYYCFATSKGGDVFTFVQEMEGVDFRGALKILAERAGIELSEESKESRSERDRLYAMVAEAVSFYGKAIEHAPHALTYLEGRGVAAPTIPLFSIGYAPEAWDTLKNYLAAKGYSESEIERAGLIKKGEKGSYYDRFRSRVMFPINDASGRPIGFSGRIIGKAAEDKENAKYINSPESALFDKSAVLFGYDRAKGMIRKSNFSILVEGQMDLVMSHQAGWGNTVAVSGTGLTERHLDLLSRLSKNMVLALDADSAGIASAHRSALMGIGKGMEVKVAVLPEGSDPADLIKSDPDAWRLAIKGALSVADFFIARIVKSENDPHKRQRRVREEVLPLIGAMPSRMDAAHFVKRVSDALSIPQEAVWQDLQSPERHDALSVGGIPTATLLPTAEKILRYVWGLALLPEAPEDAKAKVAEASAESVESLSERLAPIQDELIFHAEASIEHMRSFGTLFDEQLLALQIARLEEVYKSVSHEQKTAEARGEAVVAEELFAEYTRLVREAEELRKRRLALAIAK